MGLFDGFFKGAPAKAAPARKAKGKAARGAAPNSTQFVASQGASNPPSAGGVSASVRKDLLKVVLREMLLRNGIPSEWLSADMLRTTSPRRGDQGHGIHVRLLVRHWDTRLLAHSVALEQDFYQRLMLLDATAPSWLMGFSWQFALPDLSVCPPLPHPGSWTAPPVVEEAEGAPTTRAGDIIEGPVMIPQTQEDVRADLERLLALRDDDMKRHGDGFAPTRPVSL
jgi:hypothetical protein